MTGRTFISGISLQLGSVTPLCELRQSGVVGEVIGRLTDRGIDRFLQETAAPVDVWASCISTSMSYAGLLAHDMDLVLFSSLSNLHEIALQTLARTGFSRTKSLGLSLQDCTACIAAITVASAVVNGRNGLNHVLNLVTWTGTGSNRLGPNNETVFGDGTVSFVVSNQSGEFEILASDCWTDSSLLNLMNSDSRRSNYLMTSLKNLQLTAEQTLRKANIDHAALRAVFCTNGGSVFHDAIGLATSTTAIIFRSPLQRYGHVLACDELLGLKTYTEDNPAREGDLFLLLSWAPYAAGACVLRRCSSTALASLSYLSE